VQTRLELELEDEVVDVDVVLDAIS